MKRTLCEVYIIIISIESTELIPVVRKKNYSYNIQHREHVRERERERTVVCQCLCGCLWCLDSPLPEFEPDKGVWSETSFLFCGNFAASMASF